MIPLLLETNYMSSLSKKKPFTVELIISINNNWFNFVKPLIFSFEYINLAGFYICYLLYISFLRLMGNIYMSMHLDLGVWQLVFHNLFFFSLSIDKNIQCFTMDSSAFSQFSKEIVTRN